MLNMKIIGIFTSLHPKFYSFYVRHSSPDRHASLFDVIKILSSANVFISKYNFNHNRVLLFLNLIPIYPSVLTI